MYYEMAGRYLGVFDIALVDSWTPRELLVMVKAAQKRRVDDMQYEVKRMFIDRYVQNNKHAKPEKAFNAEKELQNIEDEYDPVAKRRNQEEKHAEIQRKQRKINRLIGAKKK